MSVSVRPYRHGWLVNVRTRLPNGAKHRERHRVRLTTQISGPTLGAGPGAVLGAARDTPEPTVLMKEVPTLKDFAPRFLDGHARANRQKPSGIAAKENILNVHLIPSLGTRRLNAITNEDVQRLKGQLQHRKPKTVNNVLGVLSVLLKKAVEWEAIERMPCAVRLLPVPKPSARFHDFETYERLIAAAMQLDASAHLVVLLGGEAGMRCGEIAALEWEDVDLQKRQLCIQRSEWKPPCDRAEGRTVTLRAHDHPARDGASWASSPPQSSGSVSVEWSRTHDEDDRGPSAPVSASRQGFRVTVCICCDTRSRRTWPCVAPPLVPFRNWRDIRTSARRNATCT